MNLGYIKQQHKKNQQQNLYIISLMLLWLLNAIMAYSFNIAILSLQIFIDRDPALFSVILNYLRTKEVDLT